MPVLVRYCLSAIWPPFVVATGTSLFVLNLLFYLKDFLNYLLVFHAGIINSFLLLLYIQPGFLILSLPIGFLVAIMIVYGRLSSDREVIAVESAGFPVSVLIWPVIAAGILFSFFFSFLLGCYLTVGKRFFFKIELQNCQRKIFHYSSTTFLC